jgi:hypothetical protein
MGVETGDLNMGTLISKGWPLVLIVVGVLYITGKIGSRRTRGGPGGGESGTGPPAGP